MVVQIVLDGTADIRHCVRPSDAGELAKAERRFLPALAGSSVCLSHTNAAGDRTQARH